MYEFVALFCCLFVYLFIYLFLLLLLYYKHIITVSVFVFGKKNNLAI